MTTPEQKQQAAADFSRDMPFPGIRDIEANCFIAGAEWAEAQQRWIPASEGLPSQTAGDKNGMLQCWVIIQGRHYYTTKYFNCWEQQWEEVEEGDDPVAFYMPISLPPIAAQEGGKQ